MVSDSEAVEYVQSKHCVAGTYDEAVLQVFEVGLNVCTHFIPTKDFIRPVCRLIEEKKLAMATLNKRTGEVLSVKFYMGLFDSPYVPNPKEADEIASDSIRTKKTCLTVS